MKSLLSIAAVALLSMASCKSAPRNAHLQPKIIKQESHDSSSSSDYASSISSSSSSCSSSSSSTSSCPSGNPLIIPSINGRTHYILASGKYNRSHDAAARACARVNGGTLANISDAKTFVYLSKCLKEPAWIASWEGNHYEGSCIALHPGGAITTLKCCDSAAFICEVPNKRQDSCSHSTSTSSSTSSCSSTPV